MNHHNLLDAFGDVQDHYLLSAIRTRKEGNLVSTKHWKPTSLSRRILIAAAIVMLLALTACAAKYVSDLFVTYFQDAWDREISDSQIEYIQNNTQPSIAEPIATEPENGYSVSVRSALTDGNIAYITVDIKAPEDVSLEGGNIRFCENPLLIPEQTEGLVIAPDGSSPDAMCEYTTIDDGDGKSNTASIVFEVSPFKESEAVRPFDGSIHWIMKAGGFYKSIFDPKRMEFSEEPLGDGNWEFDLHFQPVDTNTVEFVSEPIPMKASLFLHDEYTIDCTLTSFTLSGLGRGMTIVTDYQPGEHEILDIGDVSIVMKDGTSTTLLRVSPPVTGTAPLGTPIILKDIDHVLLVNTGEKLYPQN